MRTWKDKLTSRKLWLAIAAFVTMLIVYCTGDAEKAERVSALIMAGATVIGYIISEGLTDAAHTSEGAASGGSAQDVPADRGEMNG